jgi:hypothetical protein
MKRTMLLALCVLLAGLFRPACGSPFLFFDAHPGTASPGNSLQLDIMVGGMQFGGTDALLGGFQLGLQFDPRLQLVLTTAELGDGLGSLALGQVVVGGTPPTPGAGRFDFFAVSLLEGRASTCVFCTGPYLEDLQSDSFRLISLDFYLPGGGLLDTSPLVFDATDVILSDDHGAVLAAAATEPLVVPVAVPEPSTLAICLIGILALGWTRRRHVPRPGRAWRLALLLVCGSAAAQAIDIPLRGTTARLTVGRMDFADTARAAQGGGMRSCSSITAPRRRNWPPCRRSALCPSASCTTMPGSAARHVFPCPVSWHARASAPPRGGCPTTS